MLSEDERHVLAAALWFSHLNRSAFYDYVTRHGHEDIVDYYENNDVNELRRKLMEQLKC